MTAKTKKQIIRKSKSKSKPDVLSQMNKSIRLLQEQLKAQSEELSKKQNAKPALPPPNVIVEELPNLTLEELMVKLSEEIISAWIAPTFIGENSRQLKVFNKLNSNACQELLKEILVRKEK